MQPSKRIQNHDSEDNSGSREKNGAKRLEKTQAMFTKEASNVYQRPRRTKERTNKR